jgi:hypothetical protein
MTLITRWTDWYPTAPPVPWLLREACPGDWFRVYTLPDGKRYPESTVEAATVRARRDAVLESVLKSGSAFEAFLGRYAENAEPEVECYGVVAQHYRTVKVDSDVNLSIYRYAGLWDIERFALLLDDIAHGREPSWVLLNAETGDAIAPYDGGVDVFVPDNTRRIAARSLFADWISPRGDGL